MKGSGGASLKGSGGASVKGSAADNQPLLPPVGVEGNRKKTVCQNRAELSFLSSLGICGVGPTFAVSSVISKKATPVLERLESCG